MWPKIIFLVLAVSTADSRPQLPQIQPLFSQRQENFMPRHLEGFIPGDRPSPNRRSPPPEEATNTHFLDPERRLPTNANDRRPPPPPPGPYIPPNFEDHRGPPHNMVTLHQRNEPHNSNNQFARTNRAPSHASQQYEQITDANSRHQGELKTSASKSGQHDSKPDTMMYFPEDEEPVTTSPKTDRNEDKQNVPNETIYNQAPKTNLIKKTASKNTVLDHTVDPDAQDNETVQFANNYAHGSNADSDQDEKSVISNENSRRSSNSSDQKPVSSDANPPALASPNMETRTDDDSMKNNDDRWVWGIEDVTVTTPDLDDRASFTGDACPVGKVKVKDQCVEEEKKK